MPLPKLTWGCDPEYFVVSCKTNEIVPAWEIPNLGDKRNPRMINDRWGVLADGAAIEFNCPEPYNDPNVMRQALTKAILAWQADNKEYRVLPIRDLTSNEALWKYWDHPAMQEIGCDPDLDALLQGEHRLLGPPDFWLGGEKTKPWRTAGGHIHIGIDPWPEVPKHVFVRLLDHIYFSWFNNKVPDPVMSTYRRAGLYRDKPYGVEYRTPNSMWTSPDIRDSFARFYQTVQDLVAVLSNPDSEPFERLVAGYRHVNEGRKFPLGSVVYLNPGADARQYILDLIPRGLWTEMTREQYQTEIAQFGLRDVVFPNVLAEVLRAAQGEVIDFGERQDGE